MVLQFRFINTLAIFQRRINYVLGEHLDKFVMVYLDDIIIYLNTEEKYKKLWNEQFGKRLAKYAPWDHAINLEPGTYLRFFPIYKLIKIKNQALKEFM